MINTKEFWRYCYRNPQWREGLVKWPDGFARTYWMGTRADAEDGAATCRQRGLDAFVESQRENPATVAYVQPTSGKTGT